MLLASDRTSETSGRRPLTVLINIDNQAISGRSGRGVARGLWVQRVTCGTDLRRKEWQTSVQPRRKMCVHSCGSNILTYSAPPLALSNSELASEQVGGWNLSCHSIGRGFVQQKLFLSSGLAIRMDCNIYRLKVKSCDKEVYGGIWGQSDAATMRFD